MLHEVIKDAQTKFEQAVKHLHNELAVIRSSHISPVLIEDLKVTAYGDSYTLKELAAISLQEPSSLLVQPWDQTIRKDIEKALSEAQLGANPVAEGDHIRITIPPLSQERRQELGKRVGVLAEEARISVRNIRQEKMKSIDGLEDDGKISEDERDRGRKEIQELVDKINEQIEEIKEKKITALESN